MLIHNSIIAGEILNVLDNAKRAVSFDELKYYVEQPMPHIQAGVERLIREGYAVLEVHDDGMRVKAVPDLNQPQKSKPLINSLDWAYA